MKFKAVIIDLDGTAVDSPIQKVVTDRLAKATLELQSTGVIVCAATGRGQMFAKPVIESMNLKCPSILSGGTRIVDTEGNELWRCELNSIQLESIKKTLVNFSYNCIWNDYPEEQYLNGGWNIERLEPSKNVYLFEVIFIPHDEVAAIVSSLQKIEGIAVTKVTAQREGTNDLHITHASATKEHAIYELEKILGIDKSEMIGIGDGHNDIHLFNAVGYKVAMGNAVQDLKEEADEVIGNVNDDGLALYFEKLTKELV